jgi:nucleoside 2-deoxyribosyltransferase
VGLVVAAGEHLLSFAERLAHARGGAALHRVEGRVRAERLVLLTDGVDLPSARVDLGRVQAGVLRALIVGADPELLAAALPEMERVGVADDPHPGVLWQRLLSALDGEAAPAAEAGPQRLFLSHAAADEGELEPTVAALRRLGVEVFLCGDSLRAGGQWREQILAALRSCDRFVLVVSAASRASVWCAFEAGMALALGKPLRLILLDEGPPPPPLAHLQAEDLARSCRLRPWLGREEALLSALLSA